MCCDSVYRGSGLSAEALSAVVHCFGAVLFFASICFMLHYKLIRTCNEEERKCYECGEYDTCRLNNERKAFATRSTKLPLTQF